MIQLEDNWLSFAFPEIPRELESLLEQHIQKIRPRFVLPEDRYDLVQILDQFILHGAMWALVRNTSTAEVIKTAEALTDAEAALWATAKTNARISDDMSALSVCRHLRGGAAGLPQFPDCQCYSRYDPAQEAADQRRQNQPTGSVSQNECEREAHRDHRDQ